MENKFEVGQVFMDVYPPEAAIWCNENDAHMEAVTEGEGKYIIVKNVPYVPTLEEQVRRKEEEYHMDRVVREGILGNPDAYSEFNVARAKEIEEMVTQLREEK